jgi:primosomal protein N' (replication factor Y)
MVLGTPFGRLLALILSSLNEALLDQTCRPMAQTMPLLKGVQVLGPAPASLAILRRRHRRRFLVKTRRDIALQGVVREWLERVDLPGTVHLQFDVDPYSFL